MPLSRNLGTLTSWNPLGLSRPVMGLLYLYLLLMGYVLGAIFVHHFSHYVAHPDYVLCIWICESWDVRSVAANLNVIPFFWDMPPRYCEIGIRCFEATYRLNLQRSKCTGRSGTAPSSKRMIVSTLHLQHITNVTHSRHIYKF